MPESSRSSSSLSARAVPRVRPSHRDPARPRAPRWALLCVLALAPLHPAEAAGASDDSNSVRYEFGPTFAMPMPVSSAHRDVLGVDVGLSCTAQNPVVGFGLDLAYHYWPVSPEFKQTFNERLWILKLGEGTWGQQVFQLGMHARLATPADRGVRAWIQGGLSVYRVDPNVSGYTGDAGFVSVRAFGIDSSMHFGYSAAVGTDLFRGPHGRIGFDATLHIVNCGDRFGGDLEMLTVGAHLAFGS